MWEVSDDPVAYNVATKAYFEAISLCQWNFEPVDSYLLEVALDYTAHLRNGNNTDKAKLVVKNVIRNLQEYISENNHNTRKESNSELLLISLNNYLEKFRNIEDRIEIEELNIVEENVSDIIQFDEQLSDGIVLRQG